MKSGITYILLILTFLSTSHVGAQSPDYLKRYTPATYKAGPSIFHVIKDHRDILYFATNRGILEFDGTTWKIIETGNFSDIKSVKQAKDETIYIGANNDLGYLTPDSTGILTFKSLVPEINGFDGDFHEVWQIVFVDDKTYFQSYPAIFEWDGKVMKTIDPEDEFYIFNIEDELHASGFLNNNFGIFEEGRILEDFSNGTINDLVFSSFKLDQNRYLIAAGENGLFIYETDTRAITPWDCEATEFLKQYYFYDGIRINENTLALGTWEAGIIIIDNEGNILEKIDKNSGLLADRVNHMTLGSNNDIWVGTSDGIVLIDLDSLNIPYEPNTSESKNTIIREVRFDNQVVYARPFHLTNDELFDGEIEIKEKSGSLTFYFASPSMAGNEIQFSTCLQGFDSWTDWTSDPKKEFTSLSRGNYTFQVKAKDSNGQISEIASVPVRIQIPWYQTGLRYLLAFPAALLLAYLLVLIRTKRLQRRNKRLEKVVADRTSDLIAQQKKLEKINEELVISNKELDSFVYHTSHDLKAPLKSVMGLVSLSKKESVKNENLLMYLNMIEKSIHKLEEFIASIIEYSQNSKGETFAEQVHFDEILDEIFEELQEFEEMQQIKINRSINLNSGFRSDPKRLKIVLNNLITNSVKYHDLSKDEPKIDIKIFQQNGMINLEVTDNGSGIKDIYQDKVFDMFYRASENSWGSGLGLYIVKETISNLNGSISMNSTYGSGTTIKIELPKEHE